MAFEARAQLNEARRLADVTRGRQRVTSIPLLVFGVAVALMNARFGESNTWVRGAVGVTVIVPAVMLMIVALLTWRARSIGVTGRNARRAAVVAVLVAVFLAVFVPGVYWLVPTAPIAAGIAAYAVVRRNARLAVTVTILGVVSALLDLHFWTNRVDELRYWLSDYTYPRYGYDPANQLIATGAVVAVIVTVGLWAFRTERRA